MPRTKKAREKDWERRVERETLKEDVDRLRNTSQLINKASSRANSLTDRKLYGYLFSILDEARALCDGAAAKKVEEANAISFKLIEESAEDYVGAKGVRRRKK